MGMYDYIGKYKIFDSEVHLANSKIPEYGGENKQLRVLFPLRTPEDVVAFMDECGIQTGIVENPYIVTSAPSILLRGADFIRGVDIVKKSVLDLPSA